MEIEELAKWLYENRVPIYYGWMKNYSSLPDRDKKEMKKLAKKLIKMFRKDDGMIRVVIDQVRPIEITHIWKQRKK